MTSAPFLAGEAATILRGQPLSDDAIGAAAHAVRTQSKPLDNTDLDFSRRRAMVEVWARRARGEVREKLGKS